MSPATSRRHHLDRVLRTRRLSLIAVTLALVAAIALAPGTAAAREGHPARTHGAAATSPALNARQAAFHDAMRKLWEDHITWTRLAIVSFAAGLPDLQATEARLLANQVDIGNAIKPYYGRTAGNRLTALLKDHILGAVALLQAAKAGDQAQIANASAAWYANANQIADFLNRANPRHWSRKAMRSMMKTHLDQTLAEAQHRLQGNFAADIRDYEAVHRHILEMADMLSDGIIRQFPRRFR
jgi:hypothetical protein